MTLFIIATGIGWTIVYAHSDANSKAGQVYGNIVSEWGQLLALIVVTKGFREAGSKESWSVLHIGESASLSAERGSLG